MKGTTNRKLAAAAALASSMLLGSLALASEPMIDNANPVGVHQPRNGIWGWIFETGNSDITVDQVGFYDYLSDGLLANHRVGIWLVNIENNGGQTASLLLGYGTVSAGTGDTLDGGYRWSTVFNTPMTLAANQKYYLGAENPSATDQINITDQLQEWNTASGMKSGPVTRAAASQDGGAALFSSVWNFNRFAGVNTTETHGNVKTSILTPSTWTGGAGTNWNNAANWGGTLPSFGTQTDAIAFGAAAPASVNNDVVGASIRGLRFDAGAPAMTVTGNAWTLSGALTNNSSNTQTISTGQINTGQSFINATKAPISISSDINVGNGASDAPLYVTGLYNTTISGNLTGSSPLMLVGGGDVFLSGNNSGYTGAITLDHNIGTYTANALTGKGQQLVVSSPNALGASSVVVSVPFTGAGLKIGGDATYNQSIVMPSGPKFFYVGGEMPQLESEGNNTWSGGISLTGGNNYHSIASASGLFTVTTNLSVPASHQLVLGGAGDGVVTGTITGGGNLWKVGDGTWTVNGGASTYLQTFVRGGTLALDYTTNNVAHLGTGTLRLDGGTVRMVGNASSNSTETVTALAVIGPGTSDIGGASSITLVNGASGIAQLNAGSLVRNTGSAVDVNGTGSLIFTNALLQSQPFAGAFMTTGGGSSWAQTDAVGQVLPFAAYTNDTWASGNHTDVTTSQAVAADSTTASVRFNTATAANLSLSGTTNTLESGGILVTPSVGANDSTISGSGGLASGFNSEILVQQFNTAGSLTINGPALSGTTALTKAGPGVLVLASANTSTGNTYIDDGQIRVTDANALANSPVYIMKNNGLVFDPSLSAASIGMIAGTGDLNIGAMNLTLTSNAGPVYQGRLSGTGDITVAYSLGGTGATNFRWAGDNSGFSGDLFINNGRISVMHPKALGNTVGKTVFGPTSSQTGTLNSSAALYFRGGDVVLDEDITVTGYGWNGKEGGVRVDNTTSARLTHVLTIAGDPAAAQNPVSETMLSLGNGATLSLDGGIAAEAANPNQNLWLFTNGDSNGHGGNPQTSVINVGGNVNLGTGKLTADGQVVIAGASNTWGNTDVTYFANLQIGDGGSTGNLGTGPVTLNSGYLPWETANPNTIPTPAKNWGNLSFNRSGTLNVPNNISGTINAQGSGASVQNWGNGTVILSGTNTYNGGTVVADGTLITSSNFSNGTLTIHGGMAKVAAKGTPNSASGTTVVPSLLITSDGKLDLTNNSMVIDHTSGGADPVMEDAIRQHLFAGRILSSSAGTPAGTKLGYGDNAVLSIGSFAGTSPDGDSMLIKFTYAGDANLDGQVTISDLGDLASNWQSTTAVWRLGDFNYDGQVTISDLGDLASNWQAGVGSPLGMSFQEALAAVGFDGAAVPEPATMGMLGLSLLGLTARRRRTM